jgi:hypothetical protein
MALTTQADVQNLLHTVFDNQPEAVITDLIGRAGSLVEDHLMRKVELATAIVETLDGPWGPALFLKQWPIDNATTPVAVVEDGNTLVNGTDFLVYEDGRLVRGGGVTERWWTRNRQAIVVTYDGGYATVPRSIAHVASSIVARWFQAGAAYAAAPDSAGAIKRISLEGSDEIEYADAVSDVAGVADMSESEMMGLHSYRASVFA